MAPLYSPPFPLPTKLGRIVHSHPMQARVCRHAARRMSIGDKWQEFGMSSMDKTDSFEVLDACANFIDTENT
ncbi:hypothetical protein EDB83DRAFT_2354727 [Lactarius deliciosus]|nr:hypothetical protein EDB83DRAFT_2354727 [Lactarius deliciosus]